MLSLHSQEETDILQPFVEYKIKYFFIGLIRLKENNGKLYIYLFTFISFHLFHLSS